MRLSEIYAIYCIQWHLKQCNYIHKWYCYSWLTISVSQMSKVHKRAATDVNSQIYVCKSNRSTETIYNCSNLCRMSNTCTRSYWPHRSYTTTTQLLTTQVLHNYNTIEHIIPYNAAKSHSPTGQSSTGFRYPPLLSPPSHHQVESEAPEYLHAWLLPCCWRQTVTQPIRTNRFQTV